eukprot:COSAG04_NODE_1068_length_8484_cov_4.196064_1_plen_585_part_00
MKFGYFRRNFWQVLFIVYLADDTDLSGGNPEFNTLAVETQASTAMAVSWEYHTDEPPETLAFEVALQQVGRRRRLSDVSAAGSWAVVYYGTGTSFSFADLAPATDYAFRLRFYANAIPTLWSTAAVFTTAPVAIPDTPAAGTVTETSGTSLTISWEAPLANGAPITAYQVRNEEGIELTVGAERTAVFEGLATGTTYALEVRAMNAQGWSGWGEPVSGTTDESETPAVPDAPATATRADGGPNELLVDVGTIDPSAGGAQALALVLEIDYPEDDESWVTLSAALAPQTRLVTGLTAGTEYAFRSAVVNSAGVSAFSPTALLTTDDASPPGAPTALVQTTLWANRADLRWEAPPDGGAVIALYELEVYNGTIGEVPPMFQMDITEGLTAEITGLSMSGVYNTRLRAVNIVGPGLWSETEPVYTYMDGACSNEADATIWNDNLAQFSPAMAQCCGGCLGLAGCFINCWVDLFAYSQVRTCTSLPRFLVSFDLAAEPSLSSRVAAMRELLGGHLHVLVAQLPDPLPGAGPDRVRGVRHRELQRGHGGVHRHARGFHPARLTQIIYLSYHRTVCSSSLQSYNMKLCLC